MQEGGSKRRVEKTAKRTSFVVCTLHKVLCYKSRRMRLAWHIARMREKTASGKLERKSPIGRTRRR
jgi:hypothetical protein